MTCMPYWIQHADFESDEFDEGSAQSIAGKLVNHDWRGEFEKRQTLDGAGSETCPPGLGVNAPDGRILHICPDADDMCQVHYSFYDIEKIMGVFPRRKYEAGTLENVPLEVAARFVEPFMSNNYGAVKREVETHR